jgi:predicted nucleic acid-binding Zn ribbon protein
MAGKKRTPTRYEQRRLRTQQIIFTLIAAVIIFTWIVGLIINK